VTRFTLSVANLGFDQNAKKLSTHRAPPPHQSMGCGRRRHDLVMEAMTDSAIPEYTDEQLTGLKLQGIFMPYARRQRDKLFSCDKTARFVHYTSAENALKIISTKRLWMRSIVCMSDYREVQHGHDMFVSYFSDQDRRAQFCSAINDASSDGAAQEALGLFDGWWPPAIRFHTYIASISEHDSSEDIHGRLSMWRGFGNYVTRVGIVFQPPKISGGADALNLMFSPVAYLTEKEVHAGLAEVIQNVHTETAFLQTLPRATIVSWVFEMLRVAVTCLKHEGYKEEREWRAIYSPKMNPSPLMGTSTEVIGGVPQIVHPIPLDSSVDPVLADLDMARMFDRLIIGASPFPLPIADAFIDALKKVGVAAAENRVCVSGIPIRS
jgi:Protein of unknown function (DUF2971)